MAYDPIRPNQLFDRPLYTYKDAVDHLMDWLGGSSDPIARRDSRRACQEALREIVNNHRWSYYYQHGRVTTVANYSTGTVAYDHTGGANERQLTLSDGTWPTWAQYGTVRISNVPYAVAKRVSSTILQLEEENNPGEDIASGTSHSIYQEAYVLPPRFKQILSCIYDVALARVIDYVDPKVWLSDRRYAVSSGVPFGYTIMGSRQLHGQDALWFAPAPSQARSYDMVYLRAARPLLTEEYSTGTVSCTTGSATLTGSTTSWTSVHKGCVIRLSGNSSSAPTSPVGSNPAVEERIVLSVDSSTGITVDSAFTNTLSGVKYIISDPIDLDLEVMLNLFLRTAEKCLGRFRHRTDQKLLESSAAQEALSAMGADNRAIAMRTAGAKGTLGWVESVMRWGSAGSDVS